MRPVEEQAVLRQQPSRSRIPGGRNNPRRGPLRHRAPGQPDDPDMTADRQQNAPREANEAVISVRDNPRVSRFQLRVNEVIAGYVTYRDARSGRAFEHTVIAT